MPTEPLTAGYDPRMYNVCSKNKLQASEGQVGEIHTPSWIKFRRPVIRGARSPLTFCGCSSEAEHFVANEDVEIS